MTSTASTTSKPLEGDSLTIHVLDADNKDRLFVVPKEQALAILRNPMDEPQQRMVFLFEFAAGSGTINENPTFDELRIKDDSVLFLAWPSKRGEKHTLDYVTPDEWLFDLSDGLARLPDL